MKYLTIILILTIYSYGSRCGRDWKFEVPFTIENERITYSVDDTIWVSSILDQKLKDIYSGEKREFPDIENHLISVSLTELDGMDVIYAQEKMELFEKIGEYRFQSFQDDIIKGNSGLFIISYEDNTPNYEARFGIVMKEQGTFILQVGNISWTINDKPVYISECTDYLAGFEVKFSNESDFNFNLYDSFPKPDIYPKDKFEYVNSGLFTFAVEE